MRIGAVELGGPVDYYVDVFTRSNRCLNPPEAQNITDVGRRHCGEDCSDCTTGLSWW